MHAPPIACPADQVPDATGVTAFNRAYGEARDAGAVFVCVARSGQRWTVKTDTNTAASGHAVSDVAAAAVGEAIDRLRDRREVRLAPRLARPGSTVLYDIAGEERARQIAAALHAALHGDLDPLARAVPTA
ncbi:hypothetical protein [Streptomyces tropicalis]|uniref:Uncharacterized protein n=1 Tax=Streptomyces tropicalis TaxID=3034234 RepID=A0ABT6AE73_9ACTN|nr:hypothetical protein [Streptomyces tropicalis]MDF3302941.1 hypothetical protein [Streptomyces tropicalis]